LAVYSVSEIAKYLKEALERDSHLGDLWISGEVSNFTRSGAGHLYFTIKDAASSLRCVMFRPAQGGELLSNGIAVIAHGRVSFYEARGETQLYVDIVQPEGVGELQLKLEQLKLKLEQEGLFELSRKRHLPAFPRRIGLVTSPTGAVLHDIQNVVQRRYPLAELMLAPTPVQGDGAIDGILEAFQVLNEVEDIDVIIVARGGGSLEELWAFNEESVAHAIFASRAPVVSGIGHETDFTIADMVADHRAPTPSAAAELVVPDGRQLAASIAASFQSLEAEVWRQLSTRIEDLDRMRTRLLGRAPDVSSPRLRIDDLLQEATRHLKGYLELKKERTNSLEMRLSTLSPLGVLDRGYAIVQRGGNQEVVHHVSQVLEDDNLWITVADGVFRASATPSQSKAKKRKVTPEKSKV